MADISHLLSAGASAPAGLADDRISNLPWNVLDIILGKLPITDAARTSVLAKDWRYKWLSLSNLIVDADQLFESLENNDLIRLTTVAKIINTFLLNYSTSIKKFVLRSYCSPFYSDLYQWINYLSKQDVQVFMLEEFGEELLKMPSHLFSFKQLKCLALGSCALQVPSTFGRLKVLTELLFRNVSISDADLERLILGCPSLERLSLVNIYGLKHLRIRAPRLTGLMIDFGFEDIVLEGSEDLASVSIFPLSREPEEGTVHNWRSVIRGLSGRPSLAYLGLSNGFIALMAAEYGLDRCLLRNDSLTTLHLHGLIFQNEEMFRACLSLLSSSPNIRNFGFSVDSAEGQKLISEFVKDNQGRFRFPQLRTLKMRYAYCMGSTLKFLQFVSSHSPNLKEVTILKDGEYNLSYTRYYSVCSRLSICRPEAVVQYLPAEPDCVL